MAIRIQHYPHTGQVFIASEDISHLRVIAIHEAGPRYVELGRNADQAKVCGVAFGSVSSGGIVRAVTQGIVSGVICALAVNAGDRVTCASAGYITPLNSITPAGTINLVSGVVGGNVTVQGSDTALGWTSGLASGITGFAGTAFNTARVLGKALASGGAGSGIPLLVTLGG